MNRSSHRLGSAHMADLKGKWIWYDNDDEPIQLTDQDDPHSVRDNQSSLIGKVRNPKKQNVVKLIQHMQTEWKLQDRITANDLGNGKFLFNFESEEDLQYVLQQGPFHYNFCMFVLVRWEPIVHDDYPWIIPFIAGIPLHLWTSKNLKKIGSKLGHVDEDKIQESEGRMFIDVDTRKPLVFSKKISSPCGEEVTTQIRYDMLFKHCTFCGMLSHELSHCPKKEQGSSVQIERSDVFSWVQPPIGASARLPLLRDQNSLDRYAPYDHRESTYHRNVDLHSSRRHSEEDGYSHLGYARKDSSSGWYAGKHGGKERTYKPVSSRYGSRYAPYDKNKNKSWRPKDKVETQMDIGERARETYDPKSLQLRIGSSSKIPMENPAVIEPHNSSGQKLASLIITPSRQLTNQDDNYQKHYSLYHFLSYRGSGPTQCSNDRCSYGDGDCSGQQE